MHLGESIPRKMWAVLNKKGSRPGVARVEPRKKTTGLLLTGFLTSTRDLSKAFFCLSSCCFICKYTFSSRSLNRRRKFRNKPDTNDSCWINAGVDVLTSFSFLSLWHVQLYSFGLLESSQHFPEALLVFLQWPSASVEWSGLLPSPQYSNDTPPLPCGSVCQTFCPENKVKEFLNVGHKNNLWLHD